MSYRLGVDVGGTFTDLFLYDENSKRTLLTKVPSTLGNQATGIINGVKKISGQAQMSLGDISFFMHGTTVATNAILEAKGAKTALIVTAGFGDVLHIMRQDRPKLYDFFARRPQALIPRRLRFEVAERVLYTGEVFKGLDEEGLKPIVKELKKHDIEAIAVCLLHSYVNPVHEIRIKEILQAECPEIDVCISSDILPEIKEYERMSTTAMNAYVSSIVDRYLKELTSQLELIGINKTVHIMQSNGGIMPASIARRKSVTTVLSGPAAGVLGGVGIARLAGFENVITVDMGGTSFDICLASHGQPKLTRESEIGGHALKVPMIDMHTIGAGGGSIAWIDPGGVLKVGPQSAGAEPGPVCYGKGGTRPTVTDANLVLGRLNPDYFLGGEMRVDKDAAYSAIEKNIAAPLKMDVLRAAEGIIRVVNSSMVKGIRCVSVEKGHDPREFSLVCFGGNGPVHAVELAAELSIPKVLIPFAPGVNCAYGLLMGDFRNDYVKTYIRRAPDMNFDEFDAVYDELEHLARNRMLADGVPERDVVMARSIDIRYHGQGYELEVPCPGGKVDATWYARVEEEFHTLYERNYGFSRRGEVTETVNVRVACFGLLPKPAVVEESRGGGDSSRALKPERDVFFNGRYHKSDIYDRDLLTPGDVVGGPAVIEQKDSTTLLTPGCTAEIDSRRNIIITIGSER